jgi:inhibitor of KinA
MRLEPLGDQAVLTRWDAEADALSFAVAVRRAAAPWLIDVVQAYKTVAVFYDPLRSDYFQVAEEMGRVHIGQGPPAPGRVHRIPCYYEGPDLARVAAHAGCSVERVKTLHAAARYTVYAIGFCPGFPYLGYLPDALAGVPRLETPRRRVEAGSVGLTGRQTGIYTEVRPGGWNIIGTTPLCLVDVAAEYFPLRTGDEVEFHPIDEQEYRRRQGERLGR